VHNNVEGGEEICVEGSEVEEEGAVAAVRGVGDSGEEECGYESATVCKV